MKRRHGVEEFPEVLERIRNGDYTIRAPTDKKKYSSEVTWTAMRLIFDGENNQIQDFFYCSKCQKVFNLSLRNCGQILKRHVEKTCNPIAAGGIDDYFTREFQPTKKKKLTQDDKILIRNASVACIINDMRPISSLNGDGMTSLLSKMTYIGNKYGNFTEETMKLIKIVPSRQTVGFSRLSKINQYLTITTSSHPQITRTISDHAEIARNHLKSLIGTVFKKYGGCIALDCWTDKHKKMSYFGITLHFISEENNQLILNDRILLIRELAVESKDGDYLRTKIYEYLNEYGMMGYLGHRIMFISDRGTNIVKAVSTFMAINCFAHLIHNVVEHMLDKNPIVSSVTAIVKYFKASALHAILFEQSLKSNVSTRWNSVCTMLETFINNWMRINEILRRTQKHLKDLDSISLNELILMKNFLAPFKDATNETEATKHPTIDSVKPSYNKLLQHLQPSRTDPSMITRLKQVGLAYWTQNVHKHVTIFHDVAVFLNPLMKSLKLYTIEQKMGIWSKTSELIENLAPIVRETLTQQVIEPRNKPRRMSQAMALFMDDDDYGANPEERNELEEYKLARITDFEDILPWWHQNKMNFPRLYIVARFIFSIPASSAAAERLFSRAGRLINHRPNMRSELVDEILFLNSNFDLIEKNKSSTNGNESDSVASAVERMVNLDDDVLELVNLDE